MMMMIVVQEADRGVLVDVGSCHKPLDHGQGEGVVPSRSSSGSSRYGEEWNREQALGEREGGWMGGRVSKGCLLLFSFLFLMVR